jgi:hypothetical protein
MEPISIKNGEIRVLPLASESFGVRSMATYVETDDVKLVIDPGSALGPRFRLNPHEREYVALFQTRQAILDVAKGADLLTISHYHFDHYVPNFENWRFIWSSPGLAEKLYTGKVVLAKDTGENINFSQRKRGYMFRKLNLEYADEIRVADGQEFEFGSTKLKFSKPVYHGPEGTRLGFILMLTIRTPGCCLIHAPDVQGPMYDESLRLILGQEPDVLLIGGPPIYLSFKLDREDLAAARRNLAVLAQKVPQLVVDHHLLRSLDYHEFLQPALDAAGRTGHRLLTAAELLGQEPKLLEARRKELHVQEPIEREWYERLEQGEFKEGF